MKTFIVILCSGLLVLSSLQVISSQDAAEATTAAAEETTILSAMTSAPLSAVTTEIAQDATTVSPAGTTLANSDTTLAAVATTVAVLAAETTVLAEGTTVAETTAVADVATTAATVAETTAAVAEVTNVVADTTATDGAATTVLAVVETTAEAVLETTAAAVVESTAAVIETTVATTMADTAETTGAAETTVLSTGSDDATTIAAGATTAAAEAPTTAAIEAVTTQAAEGGAAETTATADGNTPEATTAAAGITPVPVGVTTVAGAVGETTIQDTAGAVADAGTTAAAPQGTTQPADPCTPGGYKLISEGNRHFSSETAPSCDRSLQEGWYRFMLDGRNAQITDQCIKEGSCGSKYPMRIDLGGRPMPEEGLELKVEACTVGKGPFGSTECCVARVDVVIKGCSGFHVYKLQPTPHCKAIYCVQYVDEALPRSHQAIPPPPVNRELNELSSEERANAVTFEVDLKGKPFDQDKFSEDFKEILIAVLNNPDPPATTVATTAPATVAAGETATTAAAEPEGATTTAVAAEVTTSAPVVAETTVAAAATTADASGGLHRRKKRSVKYGTDDVVYVAPTPHVLPDGKVEVVFFVKSSVNGKPVVVSNEDLLKLQEQIKREVDAKMGVKVIKVSAGVPPYILDAEASESRGEESNIFMDHLGLFVTMIVVACVCIIVIIIGLILLKKCHNGEYYIRPSVHDKDTLKMEEGKKGKKQPMESPLTDEEIMKDEKPMLETTPSINGHGKNMNKTDDDGWVVPYEELTKDQRDQPEMEDTKL